MIATIQKISNIRPIPDADKIEIAEVLGWQVVVKKGEFKINDYVVYIEIDTVVPPLPEFEFLRERNFRVRTIKLRKQISQGLIVPLFPILNNFKDKIKIKEDFEVGEILGIKHYEKDVKIPNNPPPVPKTFFKKVLYYIKYFLYSKYRGQGVKPFPTHLVKKTDETNIQNMPWVLDFDKGLRYIATEKINGSSLTMIYKNKKTGRVCSRNQEILNKNNEYFKVFLDNDFNKHLINLSSYYNTDDVIMQGEYYGKPQKNYYNIPENRIAIFNIMINKKQLLPLEFKEVTEKLNIPTCPIIFDGPLDFNLDSILHYSEGLSKINNNIEREGLVFRSTSTGRSFKVVSRKYLLHNNE